MPTRSFGSQFWVAVFFGSQFFFTEFWVAVIPATLNVLTLENCGSFYFPVFGRSFWVGVWKNCAFFAGVWNCRQFWVRVWKNCAFFTEFWVRVSKSAAVLVPTFWFLSAVLNCRQKFQNKNCRQFWNCCEFWCRVFAFLTGVE